MSDLPPAAAALFARPAWLGFVALPLAGLVVAKLVNRRAGAREPFAAPAALADLLGVPRDEVAETSLAYLRDLVDRGLLEVAS